ncbi:MAG: CopG family transcriptional regulator [Actinomycetia bacterium]|nr:CopG family transcriptional regulator [Actinomycetes bacterium]
MANSVLIHLRLPRDLLREVDALAGGRPRSVVITEALEEFVRTQHLLCALEAGRGFLADAETNQWHSDDDVDRWVETLRQGWEPPSS